MEDLAHLNAPVNISIVYPCKLYDFYLDISYFERPFANSQTCFCWFLGYIIISVTILIQRKIV